MRLIDADYLVNKMIPNCPIEEGGIPLRDFDKHQEILKLYPTIEATPVSHGRWEQCFEDWRKQIEGDKCSACGFEHYGCSVKHYHYCPNCGAKMDGERKCDG